MLKRWEGKGREKSQLSPWSPLYSVNITVPSTFEIIKNYWAVDLAQWHHAYLKSAQSYVHPYVHHQKNKQNKTVEPKR